MFKQSWQAARSELAQPVTAFGRGMFVPHEGLQVRSGARYSCERACVRGCALECRTLKVIP